MSKKLNANNFENEVLLNEGTVLVDFYADWCGPCQMIAPVLEEIAGEHPEITVGKVNVDDDVSLAMKYNVASIPTLIIMKNGKEHDRIIGFRPKNDILSKLI